MSAHFASVLVPESKTADVLAVAELASGALHDLIVAEGEDAPEVSNLRAAIEGIRHMLKAHEARAHAGSSNIALDRGQLTLIAGVAARRATSFGERTAVAMVESCL